MWAKVYIGYVLPKTRADTDIPGISETPEARLARPAPRAATWQSVPLAGGIVIYGLTTAGLNTTLSLFLADAVHAAPFLVGLFFTARAAAATGINLPLGWISDRMKDRRVMLGITSLGGAVGALCLALFHDYALVFAATLVFASLGQAGFGQFFAYAKEFATTRGRDATAFTSVMRSVFSASWVIGPPLGLFILSRYGFRSLYLDVAGLSLASAIVGRWGLPRAATNGSRVTTRDSRKRGDQERGGVWRAIRSDSSLSARTWLLLGVVLALGIVGQVYSIDIPLHVTKDLRQSPQLVGWMLGLTAGVEIPVMIAAGRLARRVGRGRMVGMSAVVAAMSFCLLPLAVSPAALLALSALIGIWQGVALSIPMIMVQDEAPGGAGTSFALYSAAFGSAAMLAGAVTGVTASAVGYGNVFWVCAAMSAVAAFLMLGRFTLGRRGAGLA